MPEHGRDGRRGSWDDDGQGTSEIATEDLVLRFGGNSCGDAKRKLKTRREFLKWVNGFSRAGAGSWELGIVWT